MKKHVKIVNCNFSSIAVAALGGEISTRQGTAEDIYDKRLQMDISKNVDLIKKVVKSGHTSILEHITLSLLCSDVSACVEEFFIRHRLASFTVKSRRYVDFSNAGYYTPDFCAIKNDECAKELEELYHDHMTRLFTAYGTLLSLGIPKEDARFVLPYSFHSNFVCTLNLRTLLDILKDLKTMHANMTDDEYWDIHDEYRTLYNDIIEILKDKYPAIYAIWTVFEEYTSTPKFIIPVKYKPGHSTTYVNKPGVSVINESSNEAYERVNKLFDTYKYLHSMNEIISQGPRELEYLNYQIVATNVTLSCLTHLLRHRMQSIMEEEIDMSTFILPESIKESDDALTLYTSIIKDHRNLITGMRDICKRHGERDEFIKQEIIMQYYMLSGNTKTVRMVINAKELLIMSKLRTCNRAQWEIREIFTPAIQQLRTFHKLFSFYGPSCFVDGKCPEGYKCCGKQDEVFKKFSV